MDNQDYPGLDVHAVAEVYRENKRLRKLFDDAGEGQYNVLALVEYYQDEMIKAHRAVRRLRRALKWAKSMSECFECTDGLCGFSRCQDDENGDEAEAEDCVHCGLAEALGEVPADECIMDFAAKDDEG